MVGRLEEGAREFREGLRLDPNATLSYANLARNYLDLNRLGEAKAVIDEAVLTSSIIQPCTIVYSTIHKVAPAVL